MTDQEQPDRDMLEPHINDRGLAYMPNIPGTIRRTSVNVHDSSNAEHDALWIETRGYTNRDGDGGAAQITIADALILASQIYALAERRGYPVPVPQITPTRRVVSLGDPVHITNPDGSTFTATVRTVRGDGTFTAVADAPTPAREAAPDYDAPRTDDDYLDPRYARDYTPRGYPYENMRSMPGVSNGPAPGENGPRPLAVILDEDITGIDDSLTRTRHDVATLADRLEYLERCYREVPRPQDVGTMAAHLAKIERLENELATAKREIKAHKDVLGQVGAEKRKLEAQLDAHHEHDDALAALVASIPEADEPEDIVDKVRAALEATTMRANGYKQGLRQIDVVLNKFAEGDDPHTLTLQTGSVAERVAGFLARERHARLREVGEPAHTTVDTSHYFGAEADDA